MSNNQALFLVFGKNSLFAHISLPIFSLRATSQNLFARLRLLPAPICFFQGTKKLPQERLYHLQAFANDMFAFIRQRFYLLLRFRSQS